MATKKENWSKVLATSLPTLKFFLTLYIFTNDIIIIIFFFTIYDKGELQARCVLAECTVGLGGAVCVCVCCCLEAGGRCQVLQSS